MPNKKQWRQFFRILNRKEKIFFFAFLALALISASFIFSNLYRKNTKIEPAIGGSYTEGIIGQPRFINPIYANSDSDRSLTELLFSGLMKYDQNLQIVPDLAEKYEILEDGKVYQFRLKENIFWQNGAPISADDVIFTIKTIQNSSYKSPLQANWVGIEAEKIDDKTVSFRLKRPYGAFLENATVKILPRHIWENISPENFPLSISNLKAIGSGPYKIKEINQQKPNSIKSITLSRNPLYFGKKPNISEINFLFFENDQALLKAAKDGNIQGFSSSAWQNSDKKWQTYYFPLPRLFAIFFNPEKSEILSDKEIRKALIYGTDKQEVIKKSLSVFKDSAAEGLNTADSPILPEIYGYESPKINYEFNLDKANEILDKAGFSKNSSGIREKTVKKEPAFQFTKNLRLGSKGTAVEQLQKCLAKFPEIYPEGEITGSFGKNTEAAVIKFQEKYAEEILKPANMTKGTGEAGKRTRDKLNKLCVEKPDQISFLKISLATVDQPTLIAAAEEIKKQWGNLGVLVEIEKFPVSQLEQEVIKPRNYESLLFGEVLGAIPDLFPFWHSSQKKDPGLNLAMYENKKIDDLLEKIRESSDASFRAENLASFQNILIEEAPALFLYSSDYPYIVSAEIKGIDSKKIFEPSKRFIGVENWFIKTKRNWK